MDHKANRDAAMWTARRYKRAGVSVNWIKNAVWRARSANRELIAQRRVPRCEEMEVTAKGGRTGHYVPVIPQTQEDVDFYLGN